MMNDKLIFSVSQLNSYVKGIIEADPNLTYVYVVGEISNFTNHYKSGHFYLSLKDGNALVRAVMFRSAAVKIKFTPQDGMRVICRGRVSLYERDGQYQFYIDDMQPDGAGALQIAFEQLTERLRSEGLFNQEHKKALPRYPERIAVITSPTGAAVQDIKNVLSRRCPMAEIVMCPVLVQGDGAANQLISAVKEVNRLKAADVIIIGRGGGSIEDLWAFNDEELARTVFNSEIPVISAVGHETDFTICDFVADMRAPTPSAAAELSVPDSAETAAYIDNLLHRMTTLAAGYADTGRHRLKLCENSRFLQSPMFFVERMSERLDYVLRDMQSAYNTVVIERRRILSVTAATLNSLSPLATLSRGFCAVYKNGAVVRSVSEICAGDKITVLFGSGSADCTVDKTFENEGQ